MKRALFSELFTIAGCLSLAFPASASDWYVDAVHGSDANGGTSTIDAWRTISHALASIPVIGTESIHVASGTYDAALGESFPLEIRPQIKLIGVASPTPPVILGTPGVSHLIGLQTELWNDEDYDEETHVQGLQLEGAQLGLYLRTGFGDLNPRVADLTVTRCTVAGVYLVVAFDDQCLGGATGSFERIRFNRNAIGLRVLSLGCTDVRFSECEFSNQVGDAVRFNGSDASSSIALRFDRTRFLGSGDRGVHVYASNEGRPAVYLEDCLIAGSRLEGVFLENTNMARANLSLLRCTVVNNDTAGIGGAMDDFPNLAEITGSIVGANPDDLVTGPQMEYTVAFSAVEDGDFAGSNGNIGGDPGFVDRRDGDWRLRWNSPCIETGDPATPIGIPDLLGTLRAVDGDLDTVEAPDMGAMEFAPLFLLPHGGKNGYLRLELWGEDGGSTTLWAAPTALGSPQTTPFGQSDLVSGAFVFGTHSVASGPPAIMQRRLWMSLLGRTYSFQALTDSSAAPLGAAWTNPIEFTLEL